jgi:hypothetical protein
MAADKASSEFVEVTGKPIVDNISAQKHADEDVEEVAVRDLKDVEVTLATITVTHKPKLFSKGMLRLWVIVRDSLPALLSYSKH